MGGGDHQLWGRPMAAKWLFLFVLEGNRSRARRIRSSEKKKKVPGAFPICLWRVLRIPYHFIPIQRGEGLQAPPSADEETEALPGVRVEGPAQRVWDST